MALQLVGTLAVLGLAIAVAGWLASRLRLPTVVGYMAVGLALSPQALDLGIPATSFEQLAHLAVLPILFGIGLELDLKRMREALRGAVVSLPLDLALPTLVLAATARLLGWSLPHAIILGLAMAMSSTLFGDRLLSLPGIPPEARRRTLGVLLAQDMGAPLLLALIVVTAGGGVGLAGGADAGLIGAAWAVLRLLLLFIVLAAVALLLVPRLLDAVARTHSHELVVLGGGAIAAGCAAVGAAIGSMELGALLAGVAAAEAGSRFVVRNALASLRDIGLAVFFFINGLLIDPRLVLGWAPLAVAAAVLFLGSKLLVHVPAGLAAGLRFPAALRSALALGTVGEFNLILVAAAEAAGGGHPGLRATVVGALLVLLVVSPLGIAAVPTVSRGLARLPAPVRRLGETLAESLRRSRPGTPADPVHRRSTIRILAANMLLLVAWSLLAAAFSGRLLAALPPQPWAPSVVYGVVLGGAVPFVVSGYRAYRSLVRSWAKVEGEAEGSANLRGRLVDAWVAVTAAFLLLFVYLLLPQTLPVLIGGVLVAIVIVALAGRQLNRFHDAITGSVTRVLGSDAAQGELLDRVLQRYPWGVHFSAVAIPRDSPVAGQTLGASRIQELTQATVAVLQRGRTETLNPPPTTVVAAGDTLVLMGDAHQLARAEALVVSSGEALRLSAQSRLATVEEVTLVAGSPLAGRTLNDAGLKAATGALVVGVWKKGTTHPEPYRPDVRLDAGDRVILLGSRLQLQRARELAETKAPAGLQGTPSPGWGDPGA